MKEWNNLLKFPGGGAKAQETPEEAAKVEIDEETKLRIAICSLRVIFSVHKPSGGGGASVGKEGTVSYSSFVLMPPNVRKTHRCVVRDRKELREERKIMTASHHDIWFMSDPPDSDHPLDGDGLPVLTPGDEIEYLAWSKENDIQFRINNGEFFPNHAAAFLWEQVREEYLKTKNESIIRPFLGRRNLISWSVNDEGILILCYDPRCQVCHRGKKESDADHTDHTIGGTVRLVPLDISEWRVLLRHDGVNAYALPSVTVERMEAEKILDIFAQEHECQLHLLGTLPFKSGVVLAAAAEYKGSPSCLVGFELNSPPPHIYFPNEEDGGVIWKMVERYNDETTRERIWIHHEWKRFVQSTRRRPPKGRFMKRSHRDDD